MRPLNSNKVLIGIPKPASICNAPRRMLRCSSAGSAVRKAILICGPVTAGNSSPESLVVASMTFCSSILFSRFKIFFEIRHLLCRAVSRLGPEEIPDCFEHVELTSVV